MRTVIIAFLLSAPIMLTACNTMEGMGQDIQVGGEKLERSADENKGPDSRNAGY